MARTFPPQYPPATRGFPPRRPEQIENSGSSGVAGVSYRLVYTASGPRIVPITFDNGTSSVGDQIIPGQIANSGLVSWSANGFTVSGTAEDALASNYWASWELDWLGDDLWNATGSVDPDRTNWPASFRFGWGVFRSSSPGTFSWGGGFGIGDLNDVTRCSDGSWTSSGFSTSQEEAVGTMVMTNQGKKLRRIASYGTRSNGNDSSRSTFQDNLDESIDNVSGQKTFLYLFISGSGTITNNSLKAAIQIMGWLPHE